ncbi:MAG: hypothetical protein B6I19_06265 [Bacteroidetes bacterium 4572_114]|nr:MAG: hypothetical protein B6I19_06265 [Bacteroidetes bacterium 4572_114]
MDLLTSTYKDKIKGTLGCFDRIIITGTVQLRANAEEIAKKIWLKKCWINEVIIMDWSIYSLPWKAVTVTNHATTKRLAKHF